MFAVRGSEQSPIVPCKPRDCVQAFEATNARSSVIHIPFPTQRLAQAALGSLSVDEELSSLVKRSFSLASTTANPEESKTVLRTDYRATTNRMLRVAVNGFLEAVGVVIQIMEELDVDVLHEKGIEGLEGVQGVEQGLTGTTITGA